MTIELGDEETMTTFDPNAPSNPPRRHTGIGDRCPTIALSAAAAVLMGLRWSALEAAEMQMLSDAVRIGRRGMPGAATAGLADAVCSHADAAASAWFTALATSSADVDEQRRRAFDEVVAVVAVTACSCDERALARRVLRSALSDTATYLFHHASAHTRLARSWPTDDVGTDIADHLRTTAQALIILANGLGPT